jgi:hypothetical protein
MRRRQIAWLRSADRTPRVGGIDQGLELIGLRRRGEIFRPEPVSLVFVE